MKRLFQALIFILLALTGITAQTRTDGHGCRLYGPVATETIEEAKILKVSEQYVEGPRKYWHTTTFNVSGEKIKEDPVPPLCGNSSLFRGRIEKSTDEVKRTRTEISYDENNKPLTKNIWRQDAQGNVIDWSFYTFSTRLGKWRLEGRWVSTFDERGNEIKTVRLNRRGTMERGETYKYDDKNDVVEHSWLEADGRVRATLGYAYEYDTNGNWIKRTTSVLITEHSTTFFEPSEVEYRTITYY